MTTNGDGNGNGWRERINGFGKPGLIGGIAVAVVYAVIQWPVAYIKEGHDAIVELKACVEAAGRDQDREERREVDRH